MDTESNAERASTQSTYGAVFADVYDAWYAHVTNVEETVDTLVRLAGGGNLLELGVGTGRIAVPLAHRLSESQTITGVDESDEMLSRWYEKLASDHLAARRSIVHRGDMADPLPDGRYSVVFCTFNTFFNLPNHDAQHRCLSNAAAVLSPGGAIVLEFMVFPEDDDTASLEVTEEQQRPDGTFVTSTSVIVPSEHRVTGHFSDTAGREWPWQICYATPRMLEEMARSAGLVVVDRWQDFGRRPLGVSSVRQVCVLRRRLGSE